MAMFIHPSYRTILYIFLFVGIIGLVYLFNHNTTYHTANLIDKPAVVGVSVPFSPYARSMQVGEVITFANEDQRTIVHLPDSVGPTWEIYLDGSPLQPNLDGSPLTFTYQPSNLSIFLFISTVFIVLMVASFFIAFGRVVLQWLKVGTHLSELLKLGISFFVGIAYLLLSWRVLGTLLNNAYGGLLLTGAMASLGLLYACYHNLRTKSDLTYLFSWIPNFVLISSVLTIFFLLFWVIPTNQAFNVGDPHMPVGAFESGRYANIAMVIAETNHLPILKQNYGQSILSAVPAMLGFEFPRLALLVWLAVAVTALLAITVGIIQFLGGGRFSQWLTTLIVLFGSPRLTLLAIQVSDNHSTPLLYNAYADTIFVIGSVFTLLCLIVNDVEQMPRQFSYYIGRLAVYGVLASLWVICGVHAVPLVFIMLIVLLLKFLISREKHLALYITAIGTALVVGVITVLPFGGMATPTRFLSDIALPGVMAAPELETTNFNMFAHSSQNFFYDPYHWSYRVISEGNLYLGALTWNTVEQIYQNIYDLEKFVWDLARSLIFVGLGLFLFARSSTTKTRRFFLIAVTTLLVAGIGPAAFVDVNQRSWEFLRFMNAGYYGGMLLFSIAVAEQIKRQPVWYIRYSWYLMVVLCMLGPTLGMGLQIAGGLERLNLAEKVNFIVSVPPQT